MLIHSAAFALVAIPVMAFAQENVPTVNPVPVPNGRTIVTTTETVRVRDQEPPVGPRKTSSTTQGPRETRKAHVMTVQQRTTFATWPSDLRTAYEALPVDQQAFYWALTPVHQDGYWRLEPELRGQIHKMAPEKQNQVWASIEHQSADVVERGYPVCGKRVTDTCRNRGGK